MQKKNQYKFVTQLTHTSPYLTQLSFLFKKPIIHCFREWSTWVSKLILHLLRFFISAFCDWMNNLAPLSQPIRSNTKTFPKPIVALAYSRFPALQWRRLHVKVSRASLKPVTASRRDWFAEFSAAGRYCDWPVVTLASPLLNLNKQLKTRGNTWLISTNSTLKLLYTLITSVGKSSQNIFILTYRSVMRKS